MKHINLLADGKRKSIATALESLKELFNTFIFDILGLLDENTGNDEKFTDDLMKIIIDLRQTAKEKKEWDASDKIGNDLKMPA